MKMVKHYANRLKSQIDDLKTFNEARKIGKENIFSIYEIISNCINIVLFISF